MGILDITLKVFEEIDRQNTLNEQERTRYELMQRFTVFFSLDRHIAMQQITSIVQSSAAQELANFEVQFLYATSIISDPEVVYRGAELYGWLKAEEYRIYDVWRGFADEK